MAINYNLNPLGPERPTQEQINAAKAAQHKRPSSQTQEPQTPETLVEAARVATDRAFDMLMEYMRAEHESGYLNLYRLVPLAALVLGDRVQVGNTSRYVYHYAKSQGYDIPSYPLSTSGEIKQFFADEGVKSIPEWYEKIGVPANDYNALQTMTAVAVRGRGTLRTLYLIKGDLTNNWLEFTSLERSGITKKLPGYQLAYLLEAIGRAALAGTGEIASDENGATQAAEPSRTKAPSPETSSSATSAPITSASSQAGAQADAKTENSMPAHVGGSRRKHHHKNPPVKVKYLDLNASTT